MEYHFEGLCWLYKDSGSWYFVSVEKNMAKEIRRYYQKKEEGWGRLKVTAQIGTTCWRTSIWFDTKHDTYLLPIKAEVRKKENIVNNTILKITILL